MIAFVRGPVAAVHVDSAVVEVGGVGLQVMCTPATLASLRVGGRGHPRDVDGRARGLADAVRVRRLRRAVAVRAAADRERRRPQAGAGDAGGARSRRAAPRGRHRGPGRAVRCPASAARVPSASCSSSRTGSGRLRAARPRRSPYPPPADDGWRDRCAPACSGSAGRRARPTPPSTPSPRSPRRPLRPGAGVDRPSCCAPRCARCRGHDGHAVRRPERSDDESRS